MTVYVIGAGVSGLAAALTAAQAGAGVTLIEATPQAGGRCRSLDDATLGRRIDNGSHVLLGANPAAFAYLEAIGARETVMRLDLDGYRFTDLETGERWSYEAGRSMPGVRPWQFLRALSLFLPGTDRTVAQALGSGLLMRRFWAPMTYAILNTPPQQASARMLRQTLTEILRHGRRGLQMHMARDGLSESFVDPALARLVQRGARTAFGQRVVGLTIEQGRTTMLSLGDQSLRLTDGDAVIVATGPKAAGDLIPDLTTPQGDNAIVNGHFLVKEVGEADGRPGAMGLVGATAQWLFWREGIVSATVSAANDLAAQDNHAIAAILWRDITQALDLGDQPLPLFRIVKEKRATFAQTCANERRRPPSATSLANLFVAGDWTDTGLPASIEGAIRSGNRAAQLALAG
ncbi:MAG: hydroxysqualene dehydroxylase HpnE [Pseudomonadota bacterium]